MNEVPFLTVWVPATEAARRIGLSRQRMNRLIQMGEFSTVHRLEGSGQYVIRRDEVDRYNEKRVTRRNQSQKVEGR